MKIYWHITDDEATIWKRLMLMLWDAAWVIMLVAVILMMAGCGTARRVVCPNAKVVKVVETEHSYLVTMVSECRETVQEVSK